MARPDKEDSVVFDLVEDNGPDDAPDVGTDAAGPRPRLLSRLPGLSRRTWVITAAVVAAVTMVSVDLVRDHRRAELMRTSSVGVASLADPPEETWTVPFDVPAGQDSGVHMDPQIVVMDGLLVLSPVTPAGSAGSATGIFEALPGFTDVVAVDPGSGEVVWRVPVDESPVCGPTGYDASVSTEVLVCVHGPQDAREVLAITPDGDARSRPVDLAEGEQVFPGPDGVVVRTERIGAPVGHVKCDPLLGICKPEDLADGRDVLITAEDAGTGVERWTSKLEFDPMISSNCQTWPETGDPVTDLDLTMVYAGAESVSVDGCGMLATLSVDGVRLDLAGDTGDAVGSSQAWVTELGSGRFAVQGDTGHVVVVDADGEILRTLSGWVQSGNIAPDAPDDLWFVTRPSGNGLSAIREDGSEAWMVPDGSPSLVTRDVVVVNRGNRLVGLDRATGAQIWDRGEDDPRGLVNFRTLTDGETVAAQLLPQDGTGEGVLVALDLATGKELWEVPMTGTAVAVDGHPVEFTSDGLRGLG